MQHRIRDCGVKYVQDCTCAGGQGGRGTCVAVKHTTWQMYAVTGQRTPGAYVSPEDMVSAVEPLFYLP